MLHQAKPAAWMVRSLQGALFGGALVYWEWIARSNARTQFLFSRPVLIAERCWTWLIKGTIWLNAWITLKEAVIGFLLGAAIGLLLAMLCYSSPLIQRVLMPFFEIGNAVPRFVFGPLFMLWFGLGITSKAVLAATLVLFVVFFATFTALREVDNNLVLKVRLMGGSSLQVFLHVLLPSAVTWVFSSLRTGLGFALAGAIVGEYIGASKGLGYRIALSEGLLDSTGVFAGLLWLIIMAIVMNSVLARAESWLCRWKNA